MKLWHLARVDTDVDGLRGPGEGQVSVVGELVAAVGGGDPDVGTGAAAAGPAAGPIPAAPTASMLSVASDSRTDPVRVVRVSRLPRWVGCAESVRLLTEHSVGRGVTYRTPGTRVAPQATAGRSVDSLG